MSLLEQLLAAMRFLILLVVTILLLTSVATHAQSTNSLKFSIQSIDQLLANTPYAEDEVQIDDMRFRKDRIQAWRNYLQSRLNGSKVELQGAYDFSVNSAWPNGFVPYVYQTTGPEAMSATKQALVESAMREWQQVASINFIPRTSEANYILIKFSGDASDAPMDSTIGMKGGQQVFRVAGWGNKLNCAHELGHALGMIHEQSRSDRDTYVTINFDKINPDNAYNFAIVPSSLNRSGYDFDSMMHYPRTAFAMTNGDITITVKAPNQIWGDGVGPQEIGQRKYLSNGDKGAMAVQYNTPLAIGGTILDAGGKPLSGVQVTLQSANTYRGQNPVTTDASGNYIFTGIPRNSGNYTLVPAQLGGTFTVASQTVNMTTTSQATVNFSLTDSVPPGLLIETPEPSGIYSSLPTAGGTATDTGGVKEVRVALARTSDLVWWNWTSGTWGTTTFDWGTNMKLATGKASWSISLPSFADGGYQVHVQSVDNSDNASPWLMRHFFMDPTPPTLAITQPGNNANLSALTLLKGIASDGAGTGVSSNLVYFTLYQDGDFWTGFNWKSGTTAQDPDVLLSADLVAGEWTYNQLPDGSNARTGQYAISAFVKDGATNSSLPNPGTTSILFTVDRTPPSGTVTSPQNGSVINSIPTGNWFSGSATDNQGIGYVNLFIRRESDGLYWNGSGWSELSTPASIITSTRNGNTWQNSSALPVPGSTLKNGAYAFIAVIVDTGGTQKQIQSDVTLDFHTTYTWTAGSYSDSDPNNNNQNWDNPANWDPYGIPDVDSKVIIPGGTPYAGHLGTVTLYQLDFSSGSVTFDKLQLNDGGTINWASGTLAASLTQIPPTGKVVITSASNKDFPYGVITNAGTITWSEGSITAGNGARIDNSGVFEATGDSYFYYSNSGAGVAFNNYPAGTFRKKTGTGVTFFHGDYGGWQFNNSGTIDVQSGILSLDQGSKNLNNGGTVSGAAKLRSTGGTLTLNGTTTIASGSRIELQSGTLTGTGIFGGSGTFEWTGGGIASGDITVNSGANLLLSPGIDRSLYSSAILRNNGNGLATLGNTWFFSSGASFINNGQFTFQSDFTIYYDNGGAAPSFSNTGTLRKSGTDGVVNIHTDYGGTRFNNSGTVDIQQGIFRLGGGGLGGGTWQASAIGLIEFTGNTMTLTNGTAFSGVGTNRVNGGRVNFDAANAGNVSVTGIFELLSGAWGGAGNFSGAGRLGWNAGTIDGFVSIAPNLQMQIGSPAEKYLSAGVITNAGTVTWSSTGQITAGNGSRIDNSGLFEATDNAFFYYNNSGAGVSFNNYPAGTFRKKTGTGVTFFHGDFGGWQFNNSGTIDVQTGILSLDQGSKNLNNGGTISGTTRLRSTGGTLTLSGTTSISNGARLELNSGNLTGTGIFGGSGTFEWTGGSIGGGNITIGPNAKLLLSPGADRVIYGGSVLNNGGTGTATLGNTWFFSSGASFINNGQFTFQSDFTIYYDNGGAAPSFSNTGTLRKSGTDGVVNIHTDYGGTRFNNSGTVDIQQGIFRLGGGGLGGGTWQASAIGLIEFTGNTMTLTNGTAFSGVGTNRVNGGRVNFDAANAGNVSVTGIFELLSGAWGGAGNFSGAGRLGWNAGTIDGFVSIAPNLQMQIGSPAEKYLSAGVITNAGTVTWSSTGQITAGNGSRIDNSGLFEATDNAFFYYNNSGAGVSFNNYPAGTFRKKTGTGVTFFHGDFGGWQFNNSGTIDVQTGILSLDQGSKNLNTGGAITGAGKLRSTGGTTAINGTTSLAAASRFELNSGTMTGTGTFSGSGTFEWSGGGIASANITVGPSANLLLSPGSDRAMYAGTVLNNNGTGTATMNNTWVLSSGATFNNNGTFTFQSDCAVSYDNGGAGPTFNNNVGATLRRNTSAGQVMFRGDYGGVSFNNSGTLDLQTGLLQVDSAFTINPTSNIKLGIKGITPGTEVAQLNFGRNAGFNGSLNVVLTNNYSPTLGSSYVVMNYPSKSGTFTTPSLPALSNGLAWKINYNDTQLVVEVVQAHMLAKPVKQVDGTYSISFSGPAVTSIQFQVSTNLVDWETLQTVNSFSGTQNFIDADAMNYPRRFYRVQITP